MSQSNRATTDRGAATNHGDDSHAKRAALAGQWRTPPHPIFPAGHPHGAAPPPQSHVPQAAPAHTQDRMQQSHGMAQPPPQHSHNSGYGLAAPAQLPDNSEDYAKALQEAYRKGAEAAARMAQQQQQMPTAASCPNFQTGSQIAPPPPQQAMGVAAEEAAYSHHVHPTPTTHASMPPDPSSSSMPPPPPQHGGHPPPPPSSSTAPPPPQYAGSHYGRHHHHHPAVPHAKPPPQQHPAPAAAAPPPAAAAPPSAKAVAQGRSLSLPDMSAYAAQAEEEKRQKRLARNRASARLRRLRKKNLVDAYETEVGILEKTLKQLQAHEWGQADNHTALLDALGMERGQQAIAPEQRTEIIQDILKQQMQHVELLRQAQMEQECLELLVNAPDDEMSKELQSILQLTDAQKANIKTSSKGLDKEVEALETVASSLEAMLENKWLLNEGVQDANVESIDQLDHVQVQPLQGAPIFSFGVESTPGDDEEK